MPVTALPPFLPPPLPRSLSPPPSPSYLPAPSLQLQEAAALLEADRSEGVHSLILHPQLRVMWRK